MNLPDKIYEEFIKETEGLIRGDMTAVQVVGEMTRALKRVTNKNGGTAITIDGVKYDINDKVID